MLTRGMLQTENPSLRKQICSRMQGILCDPSLRSSAAQPVATALNQSILDVQLSKILALTEDPRYEHRCQTFYESLSISLEMVSVADMQALEPAAMQLIGELA